MHVRGVAATDEGRQRDHNEDAYYIDDALGLYVVCDGMGGHAAGEVASAMATRELRAYLEGHRDTLDRMRLGLVSDIDLRGLMEAGVQHACREVYQAAKENPKHGGMGCTLTGVLMGGGKVVMGHVGDSRLYLLRDAEVHQISQDHKMGEELIKAGILTRERLAKSPYRHALTRSIGTHESVQVDTLVMHLIPRDRFMLCSDGLHDYVENNHDLEPYLKDTLDDVPAALVALANASGGHDNITVVVVDIKDDETMNLSAITGETKLRWAALRSSALFKHLPMARLAHVTEMAETVQLGMGDALTCEGDDAALIVVVSGKVQHTNKHGVNEELGFGDTCGEATLYLDDHCTASLTALESSVLLRFPQTALKALMRRHPWLGVLLLERLATHLSAKLHRD
jgi:PPM family protein phosphatase